MTSGARPLLTPHTGMTWAAWSVAAAARTSIGPGTDTEAAAMRGHAAASCIILCRLCAVSGGQRHHGVRLTLSSLSYIIHTHLMDSEST